MDRIKGLVQFVAVEPGEGNVSLEVVSTLEQRGGRGGIVFKNEIGRKKPTKNPHLNINIESGKWINTERDSETDYIYVYIFISLSIYLSIYVSIIYIYIYNIIYISVRRLV